MKVEIIDEGTGILKIACENTIEKYAMLKWLEANKPLRNIHFELEQPLINDIQLTYKELGEGIYITGDKKKNGEL